MTMPKYLIEVNYTADGLRALQKDSAAGRKAAVTKAVTGLGGKIESFYFAFGEHDIIAIVDLPDSASAAALALASSATGRVRTKTTALLTMEETDAALKKRVDI
jgi:uncharacterized protein with GYD domain